MEIPDLLSILLIFGRGVALADVSSELFKRMLGTESIDLREQVECQERIDLLSQDLLGISTDLLENWIVTLSSGCWIILVGS